MPETIEETTAGGVAVTGAERQKPARVTSRVTMTLQTGGTGQP